MKLMHIEGLCSTGVWARLAYLDLTESCTIEEAEFLVDNTTTALRNNKDVVAFGSVRQQTIFNPTSFLAIRCTLVGFDKYPQAH